MAHPSNPRRDYGDLTSLRQTIVEQGVLQALTVIPEPDGGFRVAAGHRRAAAAAEAIEAGEWPATRPATVPCLVRPDLVGLPADVVALMLVENDQRMALKQSERAAGYAQLAAFDLRPEDIARRTGQSVTHVNAALKLHSLGQAVAAHADEGRLTLDDVAALDEFADDPKAVARILKGVANSWGVQHRITEERRKRQQAADVKRIREDLNAAGVTEVPRPKGWPYQCAAAQIADLRDADDQPVDVEQVKARDGFGAFIDKGYTVEAVHICLDPRAAGYRRVGHTYYKYPDQVAAEAEENKRWQERIATLQDAQPIRHQFLAHAYGNAKAAKAVFVDALRVAVLAPGVLADGDAALVETLAGVGLDYAGDAKLDALTRLLGARWIAAEEDHLSRLIRGRVGSWRNRPARGVAWLDRLVADGYTLSTAEAALRDELAAEVTAQAEAAREAEEQDADEAVEGDEADDDTPPSRVKLFHLPDDAMWVLADEDSGQPISEHAAAGDAVADAQTWAAGVLADLGYGARAWRREHADDANMDYYLAEFATMPESAPDDASLARGDLHPAQDESEAFDSDPEPAPVA